jgi:hypothetical protein
MFKTTHWAGLNLLSESRWSYLVRCFIGVAASNKFHLANRTHSSGTYAVEEPCVALPTSNPHK